jgi:regulator of RNase E activity RraA
MQVQPGDLVHGDRHGVQTIPFEIANKVAVVAQEMVEQERKITQLCQSPMFSVERLRADIAALSTKRKTLED